MQTARASHTPPLRRRPIFAACALAALAGLLVTPGSASSQTTDPDSTIIRTMPDPPTPKRVRVPTSHANVQMGPSSGQQILVLVPQGTELNVLARNKEWLQVEITPAMRKTGMVMRWYKNEDRGWMHDSTVEAIQ